MENKYYGIYYPHPVAICNSKSNVALVTSWSNPEKLGRKNKSLIERVAFIGSVNRKEGITLILNELYRYMHIDTILIWPSEKTSWIPDGPEGREILNTIWEDGVDDRKKVIGTEYKLNTKFDASIIRDLISNVDLIDARENSIDELLKVVKENLSTSSKWFMQNLSNQSDEEELGESY